MKKIITNTFFSLLICMLLGTSSGEVQARYSTRIQKSDTITETKEDQSLATAVSVSVGVSHTCVVTLVGGVRCWGNNVLGMLGNGENTNSSIPVDVIGLESGVDSVSVGGLHTCVLTSAGGVKCWGYNFFGQLGNGSNANSITPVNVIGLESSVLAISAGDYHTCAVTTEGGVKCWGNNDAGQLGDGTTTSSNAPVDVIGLDSGMIAVSCGYLYNCALTEAGEVKCWGNNDAGQLGDGTTISSNTPVIVNGLTGEVKSVTTGYQHTCAITDKNGVKCWGSNSDGQIGDGTTDFRLTPVDVSGLTSGVKAVSVGGTHTCALTNQGKVKCWGDNENSKLGDTTMIDRHTPVLVGELSTGMKAISAGSYHTCSLSAGGAVKCWGTNGFGQLGDGTTTRFIPPSDVAGLTSDVVEVSANYQYTCALTTEGGVKYWGNRFFGSNDPEDSLENTNKSIPVDVEGLTSGVQAISTGKYHTCAVTEAGGVKCWGYNGVGQLGDGTTDDSLTPVDVVELTDVVVTDLSAGDDHTCALTEEGEVKCWGKNFSGQLGNGETTNSSTPVDVIGLTSEVVVDISASAYHTCAVTEAGGVKCWGGNSDGQLGNNSKVGSLTPVDAQGFTDEVVKAVSTGENHTCAVTTSGVVKCWGDNDYGQLGDVTTNDSLIPVVVFGFDDEENEENVMAISAGNRHTCVVTSSGAVKCWGDDGEGQLGIGTFGYKSLFPVDVVGLSDGVLAVSAGTNHTCAITDTKGIKCWGDNTSGQIGWKQLWVPVDVIGFVEKFLIYMPMIDR